MDGSPSVKKLLESKGRAVVTIAGSRLVRDCAAVMGENGVGSLLVLDDEGGLAGILTWHDVLACVADRSDELATLQAADAMSTNARSTTEDADLKEVESMMVREGVRHLPVLADDKVVGIITRIDVLRHHLDEADALTEQLERYINGQYP